MTAVEIAAALSQLDPPILVSARTVERDCEEIQRDSRRYLTAARFDARFEVGAALLRHELLARWATQCALAAKDGDGAKWARVAILATQARTDLCQDIGLIDRRLGTVFVDDTKNPDRIPNGVEMQRRFESVNVTPDEITSVAEIAQLYGDAEAFDRARKATDGIPHPPTNGNGNGSR
jgi:hypothetical protein